MLILQQSQQPMLCDDCCVEQMRCYVSVLLGTRGFVLQLCPVCLSGWLAAWHADGPESALSRIDKRRKVTVS